MNRCTATAICGKGGVGKTSFTALMVNVLAARKDKRILVIDADPACGLATSLGVTVQKTIDDIRKNVIHSTNDSRKGSKAEALRMIEYELFSALAEEGNLALLAIGRPEDAGCYCRVNDLLKDIIADLVGNFDLVIIDGEAGTEQINRRVMKTVDNLVIVSDMSKKAIDVAKMIHHVAVDNRAVDTIRMGLVLNRARSDSEAEARAGESPLELLGWIPEDETVREYDFHGRSFFGFPDSAPSMKSVMQIVDKLHFS